MRVSEAVELLLVIVTVFVCFGGVYVLGRFVQQPESERKESSRG